MDFFVNPVAYLIDQGGPGIKRILFVPNSGNDGPSMPQGSTQPHWSDDIPDIEFQPGKTDDRDDLVPLFDAAQQAGGDTRVEFLHRGAAISVYGLWEFVPYNEDPEDELPVEFCQLVQDERGRLLCENTRRRNNALRRLKNIYDKQLGDSSDERNVISLVLYSGPVYLSWKQTWLYDVLQDIDVCCIRSRHPCVPSKCSIMYSGDSYLDTPERLQRLVDFFGKERIDLTGVFQVMHHGSERNWHKGVASAIAPLISIFSSNPERKRWGHPHASVLRDFWCYGPCQVDRQRGVVASGCLW